MARGIIKRIPDGGTGRIIVTDTLSSGVISGGGGSDSVDSVGGTAPSLELGQVVDYSEASSGVIGDVVDFQYDGSSASHLNTVSKATVITGTYQPNITINQGETVLLMAATLNGVLITINGGCLTVIDNTVIKGRIVSTVDGSRTVISDGTQMNGNFEFSGASSFSMSNSTSQGSIESNGNNYASVTGCTIKGSLTVLNAKTCNCSGNTVSGSTNTPGC
jgi:hypothetical protein